MRKLALATVVAAFGAGLAGPALAGTVHGTITSYDPQSGTIVLNSPMGPYSYRLQAHAAVQPGALRAGQQVALRVDDASGELVTSVQVD